MSPHVLAAEGEGFVPPTPADFWQPLIGDGAFAITRSMFLMAFSVVIITVFMLWASKQMSVVPSKRQYLGEGVYGFVRNSVAVDILGQENFRRFLPLLLTQFLLILVNNLFGIIPVIQFPTFSRIGFAVAVTLVTYVVFHYVGIQRKGVGGYFKGLMPSGIPGWVAPFVYVLELMTFFITRPLTLGMRLFANMFAGHMLLLVFMLGGGYMLVESDSLFVNVSSIASFALAIVMTFFELLIQFLQAYVFVLLTALYIAGSLADEH